MKWLRRFMERSTWQGRRKTSPREWWCFTPGCGGWVKDRGRATPLRRDCPYCGGSMSLVAEGPRRPRG